MLLALPTLASPPNGEPPPALITSLVPRGGPVLGETTVTIRGANLEGTQACRFGSGPARPATVQTQKPSPSVLCTTPAKEPGRAPEGQLVGYDETISLSKWAGTWLNPASLEPESAQRTWMLGGTLNFRFYSTRTLGVEPVVGRGGPRRSNSAWVGCECSPACLLGVEAAASPCRNGVAR